jgi:hypothetical protein
MTQPYERAYKKFAVHQIRIAEVPVEHFISQALPTLRWSRPAYAGFAGPAMRIPGQPFKLGTPDRWWAISADHGRLLAYALVSAVPFAESIPAGPVTVQPVVQSLSAVEEGHRLLAQLLTGLAPAFFGGENGDAAARDELAEIIGQFLHAEAMPWYRALTPDFFSWLERS